MSKSQTSMAFMEGWRRTGVSGKIFSLFAATHWTHSSRNQAKWRTVTPSIPVAASRFEAGDCSGRHMRFGARVAPPGALRVKDAPLLRANDPVAAGDSGALLGSSTVVGLPHIARTNVVIVLNCL
jgi:hypothetical protein